jgi:hypothetical protein
LNCGEIFVGHLRRIRRREVQQQRGGFEIHYAVALSASRA